jgi:hypothetical protein
MEQRIIEKVLALTSCHNNSRTDRDRDPFSLHRISSLSRIPLLVDALHLSSCSTSHQHRMQLTVVFAFMLQLLLPLLVQASTQPTCAQCDWSCGDQYTKSVYDCGNCDTLCAHCSCTINVMTWILVATTVVFSLLIALIVAICCWPHPRPRKVTQEPVLTISDGQDLVPREEGESLESALVRWSSPAPAVNTLPS